MASVEVRKRELPPLYIERIKTTVTVDGGNDGDSLRQMVDWLDVYACAVTRLPPAVAVLVGLGARCPRKVLNVI